MCDEAVHHTHRASIDDAVDLGPTDFDDVNLDFEQPLARGTLSPHALHHSNSSGHSHAISITEPHMSSWRVQGNSSNNITAAAAVGAGPTSIHSHRVPSGHNMQACTWSNTAIPSTLLQPAQASSGRNTWRIPVAVGGGATTTSSSSCCQLPTVSHRSSAQGASIPCSTSSPALPPISFISGTLLAISRASTSGPLRSVGPQQCGSAHAEGHELMQSQDGPDTALMLCTRASGGSSQEGEEEEEEEEGGPHEPQPACTSPHARHLTHIYTSALYQTEQLALPALVPPPAAVAPVAATADGAAAVSSSNDDGGSTSGRSGSSRTVLASTAGIGQAGGDLGSGLGQVASPAGATATTAATAAPNKRLSLRAKIQGPGPAVLPHWHQACNGQYNAVHATPQRAPALPETRGTVNTVGSFATGTECAFSSTPYVPLPEDIPTNSAVVVGTGRPASHRSSGLFAHGEPAGSAPEASDTEGTAAINPPSRTFGVSTGDISAAHCSVDTISKEASRTRSLPQLQAASHAHPAAGLGRAGINCSSSCTSSTPALPIVNPTSSEPDHHPDTLPTSPARRLGFAGQLVRHSAAISTRIQAPSMQAAVEQHTAVHTASCVSRRCLGPGPELGAWAMGALDMLGARTGGPSHMGHGMSLSGNLKLPPSLGQPPTRLMRDAHPANAHPPATAATAAGPMHPSSPLLGIAAQGEGLFKGSKQGSEGLGSRGAPPNSLMSKAQASAHPSHLVLPPTEQQSALQPLCLLQQTAGSQLGQESRSYVNGLGHSVTEDDRPAPRAGVPTAAAVMTVGLRAEFTAVQAAWRSAKEAARQAGMAAAGCPSPATDTRSPVLQHAWSVPISVSEAGPPSPTHPVPLPVLLAGSSSTGSTHSMGRLGGGLCHALSLPVLKNPRHQPHSLLVVRPYQGSSSNKS